MRWRRGRGRDQIEDRRGQQAPGLGGLRIPLGGLGGGGLVIVIVIILLTQVLGGGDSPLDLPGMPGANGGGLSGAPDPNDQLADFVAFVVDDVQDSWARTFQEAGKTYERTSLVLFSQATNSGCGQASSQTGPFYCPADRKVYLDLDFFHELHDRFGAPGDFAQAYVIAHEFGHHVQTLLGIEADVRGRQQDRREDENDLSIRLELQADCFAGVWGHSAYEQNILEGGDHQEGLDAAAAVGDDRIQGESGGRVNRETWTHGSSAQRVAWFEKGFKSGKTQDCDTFSGNV